jgi:hypothetical protein
MEENKVNRIKFWNIFIWINIIIIFCTGNRVFGQRHKVIIGTGRLQIHVSSLFADKQERIVFPREYEIYQLKSREFTPTCAKGSGIIIAAKDFQAKAYYKDEFADPGNWTIEDKFFPYFMVDATAWYTEDVQHSTIPVSGGARRFWKQSPPKRIVSGVNHSTRDWIINRDFLGPSDMPTDQMGVAVCKTSMGITVTERAYVFDNAEFAIVEYTFKYTGTTGNLDNNGQEITYSDSIKDCYVGIKFRPIIANKEVVANSSGWKEGTDDWVDYIHEEDGELLRVVYGWDGDAGQTYQLEDDEGDPLYFSSGLFTAERYPGMAVLHADKSTNDHTDDPDLPRRFHTSYGGPDAHNILTMSRDLSFEDIYKILDEGPDSPSPFNWIQWKTAGTPGDDSQFWYYNTPHATDEKRINQMGTLGFGPYQFNNIGDSVQIVLCCAVGTIGWEKAIDLGAQWKIGSIDKGEKNRILRSGRDSLFAKIKSIKEVFEPVFQTNNGFLWNTLNDIAEEIGSPLAWPDSSILDPVVGGCRVRWTPVENAAAYRVYRREQVDFDIAEPKKESAYKLIYQTGGENPGEGVEYSPTIDSTVYIDRNVYSIFNYWYYITALNDEGVESSHFILRTNPLPANNILGSIKPFEQEYINLNEVYVIPNPYHTQSLKLYNWPEDVLTFMGLPANCRIRIFSQNGTLVFNDHHQSKNLPASRYDWNMRSSMHQSIASGLYVYVIDRCKDFNGNDINDIKKGKFIVVQ